MTDKRIVLTTAGTPEEARKIACLLVELRLAACVNISGPIESVYRWKGQVETAHERLLIIKTTAERCPPLLQALKEMHSYEMPECVQLVVEEGSEEYLRWVEESTTSDMK